MFESFLVQVRVSGGFPTQTQVRVTSEPMSVVVGFGSTTIRGATEEEKSDQSESLGSECQLQSVLFPFLSTLPSRVYFYLASLVKLSLPCTQGLFIPCLCPPATHSEHSPKC